MNRWEDEKDDSARELSEQARRTPASDSERVRRRESGDMLWKSMEMFRVLVDILGEGVAIVDSDERFYMVNASGERIFGVAPGTLTGRHLTEFVSVATFARIQKHSEMRRAGKTTSYDIDIVHPGGERRTINVTAGPIFDGKSGHMNTLGLFRDVTERNADAVKIAELTKRVTLLEAEIAILKSSPEIS